MQATEHENQTLMSSSLTQKQGRELAELQLQLLEVCPALDRSGGIFTAVLKGKGRAVLTDRQTRLLI